MILKIFLCLVALNFILVMSSETSNQKMVDQIVGAITKSGISSGINEAHLKKVLNSDSLNTDKATINVINIVPKKKTQSINSLANVNEEISSNISPINLSKTVASENYLKQNPYSSIIPTKDFPTKMQIPPDSNSMKIQDQKQNNQKAVISNKNIIQNIPIQPKIQKDQKVSQSPLTNPYANIQSTTNPSSLSNTLQSKGSRTTRITFQTSPFTSPLLGKNNKIQGRGNKVNQKIISNDNGSKRYVLKQVFGRNKRTSNKISNSKPCSNDAQTKINTKMQYRKNQNMIDSQEQENCCTKPVERRYNRLQGKGCQ